jgi:transposase
MIIVGVDYHPSVQQVAFLDTETGETGERRLNHSDGEAERFYRDLQQRQVKVRVGIEATGHARWFERLLAELKFELWIGDPARIKAARVRKQKTDRQDAQLLLRLLVESRFPRIWVPTPENRDLRQLIWHRHRLVQMRTRAMNQIQAAAMNEGVRRKKTLWSKTGRRQLEALQLAPWATRRRQDLLELVDRLNGTIAELTTAIEQEIDLHDRVKCFGEGFSWFRRVCGEQGGIALIRTHVAKRTEGQEDPGELAGPGAGGHTDSGASSHQGDEGDVRIPDPAGKDGSS